MVVEGVPEAIYHPPSPFSRTDSSGDESWLREVEAHANHTGEYGDRLAEEQEAEKKEQEEMASLEWWETDSSDDEHIVTGGPAPKRLVRWTPPTPPRLRHPFHEQLERDWDCR